MFASSNLQTKLVNRGVIVWMFSCDCTVIHLTTTKSQSKEVMHLKFPAIRYKFTDWGWCLRSASECIVTHILLLFYKLYHYYLFCFVPHKVSAHLKIKSLWFSSGLSGVAWVGIIGLKDILGLKPEFLVSLTPIEAECVHSFSLK